MSNKISRRTFLKCTGASAAALGTAALPVSYTHLDVYKRQFVNCSISPDSSFSCS